MSLISVAAIARRLVSLLVAQLGLRLDRARAAWVAALAASLTLALLVGAASSPPLTHAYFALTWAFYYVGNSWIFAARRNEAAIGRLGEDLAYRRYEVLLGAMFLNQGLGLGAMIDLGEPSWPWPLGPEVVLPVALGLVALGAVIKLWAMHLVGLDVHYYRDLFLGHPCGTFVRRGPYLIFRNPIYGVGHLHAYGLALINASPSGLLAAALCQAGMYAFYFLIERPFVARMYPATAQ